MSTITIDERSALVLIDLQNGILALPTLVNPEHKRSGLEHERWLRACLARSQ